MSLRTQLDETVLLLQQNAATLGVPAENIEARGSVFEINEALLQSPAIFVTLLPTDFEDTASSGNPVVPRYAVIALVLVSSLSDPIGRISDADAIARQVVKIFGRSSAYKCVPQCLFMALHNTDKTIIEVQATMYAN